MEQAEVIALLDFLNKGGFSGQALEQALRRQITLNLPAFQIMHQLDYGAERMDFLLCFKKDYSSTGYQLVKYVATHRAEIVIAHCDIQGIATDELELRMQQTDWRQFFMPYDSLTTEQKASAAVTMSMLNTILQGDDQEGGAIQQALMYKYWPSEYYNDPAKIDLQSYHEQSRDFLVDKTNMCHAHLAYHMLSGRLDDLYEKITVNGAGLLFKKDLYLLLMEKLSSSPRDFSLEMAVFDSTGYCALTMPISIVNDWYTIDEYTLSFKPYSSVEDKVYNGVNVRALGAQMELVDWMRDDALIIVSENEPPRLKDNVISIQHQLATLCASKGGAPIATLLQVKHWASSPYFASEITNDAWDLFNKMPRQSMVFSAESPAQVGLNLLQGRAVAESVLYPDRKQSHQWLQLNKADMVVKGGEQVQVVADFEEQALHRQVAMLPISGQTVFGIVKSLMRGDVTIANLNNSIAVFLEVDIGSKSLVVYDGEHRYVPTNLHFSAQWQSPQQNHGTFKAHRTSIRSEKPSKDGLST